MENRHLPGEKWRLAALFDFIYKAAFSEIAST